MRYLTDEYESRILAHIAFARYWRGIEAQLRAVCFMYGDLDGGYGLPVLQGVLPADTILIL